MNAHQIITWGCPSNSPQCFLVLAFRHWRGSWVLSFPWGTHFRPSAFFLSEWICLEPMIWLCSFAHLLDEHTCLWWFNLSHYISLTHNRIYCHCWTVPESDSHNFCWKLSTQFQVSPFSVDQSCHWSLLERPPALLVLIFSDTCTVCYGCALAPNPMCPCHMDLLSSSSKPGHLAVLDTFQQFHLLSTPDLTVNMSVI